MCIHEPINCPIIVIKTLVIQHQQKPQEFSPGHRWVAIPTACPWRRWHPVIEELFGGARFGNPNLASSSGRMQTSDRWWFLWTHKNPWVPKIDRQADQTGRWLQDITSFTGPQGSGRIKKDDPRVLLPRLRDLPVSRCAIAVPPWDISSVYVPLDSQCQTYSPRCSMVFEHLWT